VRADRIPLARAGGGEDLGADAAGDLRRRHAHAAGRRVDQHLLPRAQPGQVDQAVVRGEVGDRHRGRLHERPAVRHRGDQAVVGDREGPERLGDQPHHAVARLQGVDAGAGVRDDARALAADRGLARVDAERDQHVAEVHAGGAHRDADLAGFERAVPRVARFYVELVEGSAVAGGQTPRAGGRRVLRGSAGQPRGEEFAVAQRDLGLAVG
jgi:hypothetical protein